MIRAISVLGQHHWRDPAADTVVLEFDDRHRRRLAMQGTRGLEFLLDLPDVIALRGGDALLLDDGRLIEVVAAPEPLAELRSKDTGDLMRIAWHLGNRHLPVQFTGRALRIRRDHVIEAMVRGLGARVVQIEAPFDPEGGAYATAQPRSGDPVHHHDDHAHHGHKHAHGPHDHNHSHDAACEHDHDHDHAAHHGDAPRRDHAS